MSTYFDHLRMDARANISAGTCLYRCGYTALAWILLSNCSSFLFPRLFVRSFVFSSGMVSAIVSAMIDRIWDMVL